MDRDKLISAAEAAISATRIDNSVVTGDTEPNQVARIVAALPDELIEKWKPYVTSGAVTVSSVFCHLKPMVEWTSPFDPKLSKHPELADLLIILDGPSSNKRALLLQVKVGSNGKFSIGRGGPQAQRYMYEQWPAFSVRGLVSSLPHQPNNPTNIAINPDIGTRYICVDEDKNATQAWLMEDYSAVFNMKSAAKSFEDIPAETIIATKSLSEVLVEMYEGKYGQPIDQGDPWSKLVDYLVDYAYYNQANDGVLSHTTLAKGVKPIFIERATSFLSNSLCLNVATMHSMKHIVWPRYWSKKHFAPTVSDWCQPYWINSSAKNGALINWYSNREPVGAERFDIEGGGFGVIRISIDEPFEDEEQIG